MNELTLDEKSSKSLSLAIRRPDMARRANAVDAGWNAAAYLSAERATVAIIVVEEKGAMVSFREVCMQLLSQLHLCLRCGCGEVGTHWRRRPTIVAPTKVTSHNHDLGEETLAKIRLRRYITSYLRTISKNYMAPLDLRSSIRSHCLTTPTMPFAALAPLKATAGNPIPGNTPSPARTRLKMGVLPSFKQSSIAAP